MTCALEGWLFSSSEAAIVLVSTKDRDLWQDPTPEVRDSRTHCSLRMLKKLGVTRGRDIGADQKDRSLRWRVWG